MSGPEEASLASARKIDPSAHELYLRGRHLMTRRTEPELRSALNYFEQAARLEPHWACRWHRTGVGCPCELAGCVPPKVGYPKAKAAARQALAIDDSLVEAHTALASVHELHDWDLTAAERRYQRAIALNPNYALAHHRYGMFLGRSRRAAAALAAGQRARELDPLSVEMNMGLSGRLFAVGRSKEALAQMQGAIELDRNYFDGYVHVADFYQREGDIPQAIAAAERGIVLSERSAHAIHGLALIYVRLGDRKKAAADRGTRTPHDTAQRLRHRRPVSDHAAAGTARCAGCSAPARTACPRWPSSRGLRPAVHSTLCARIRGSRRSCGTETPPPE